MKSTAPDFDWKRQGFETEPTEKTLTRPVHAFRIWGGGSEELGKDGALGICLTTQRPLSRRHAEAFLAIFEYGNNAQFLTPFTILPGATVWSGKVDQGDPRGAGVSLETGSQIWMRRDLICQFLRKTGPTRSLQDDMHGSVVLTRYIPEGTETNH